MNPKLKIPAPLKSDHDELHAVLLRACREEGETGAAARTVGALLNAHVVKEEQFGLLPLGLMEALSRGEVTPDMDEALVLVDRLSRELPAMLSEHREIVAALQKLLAAARASDQVEYAEFAEHLVRHIQLEEHLIYPAVLLIGRYLRLRLGFPEM
jgi:hypothetical protein